MISFAFPEKIFSGLALWGSPGAATIHQAFRRISFPREEGVWGPCPGASKDQSTSTQLNKHLLSRMPRQLSAGEDALRLGSEPCLAWLQGQDSQHVPGPSSSRQPKPLEQRCLLHCSHQIQIVDFPPGLRAPPALHAFVISSLFRAQHIKRCSRNLCP